MSQKKNARKRRLAQEQTQSQGIGLSHEPDAETTQRSPARSHGGHHGRHESASSDPSGGREVGLRSGGVARGGGGVAPGVENGQLGEQGELFQVAQYRSAPLPTPEELAAYGQIEPTLVDRIVGMAEVSTHGRYEIQRRAVGAESAVAVIGAVAMALVAVGGLVASIFLIVAGYETTALLTAMPGILIGIGQIVNASRKKSDD